MRKLRSNCPRRPQRSRRLGSDSIHLPELDLPGPSRAFHHEEDLFDRFVDVNRGARVAVMGVTYGPKMLSKHGGRQALEAKLTGALGLPDTVKGNTSYWHFPNVHRKVGYQQSLDGSSTLLIIDTAIDKQRRESQADSLDIGF